MVSFTFHCHVITLFEYVTRTQACKTSEEKQDLILKLFDYFEAESKLSLGESEMNISCMLGFW
jgi:hypothetical protein